MIGPHVNEVMKEKAEHKDQGILPDVIEQMGAVWLTCFDNRARILNWTDDEIWSVGVGRFS